MCRFDLIPVVVWIFIFFWRPRRADCRCCCHVHELEIPPVPVVVGVQAGAGWCRVDVVYWCVWLWDAGDERVRVLQQYRLRVGRLGR